MPVFVNMDNEVDKCLSVFEKNVCLGWSESGEARLVRTISKALTMHGCEKSVTGKHFQAYPRNKDKIIQLVTFEDIGTITCFVLPEGYTIIKMIKILSDPNDLLKSDIQGQREIDRKSNILDLNPLLEIIQLKLEEYSKDSSALLEGETLFPDEMLAKGEVYHSLFEFKNATIETYTQMILELATGRMLLILERQVKYQLKCGNYYSPGNNERHRAAAVTITNPHAIAASIVCIKSIIMWTNNETSAWIADKTKAERGEIIEQARKDTAQMQLKIKERRNKLLSEKLKEIKGKQDRKIKKQGKEYTQNIELFQKQFKGTKLSVDQLEENLKTILTINATLENQEPKENQTVTYTAIDCAMENVREENNLLETKIKSSRHKLKLPQQKYLLPKFIDGPHLFFRKTI
ncbi:hypothetical protein MAR_018378 [Mya arenaria]|uniref:Uncharacterized protein n=1 Tax=Mya arenaria TaxID=6604 RepID=A0ABY7EEG9_MYAAR|nr:hypothetical protein MAR_018378 [Mya arenaria]